MRSNRSKIATGLSIVLAVLFFAFMIADSWLGSAPEYRWLVPAGLMVFAALFAVLLYGVFIADADWRRENPALPVDTSLARSPIRRTVIGLTAVTGAALAADLAFEIYGLPRLPIAIGDAVGTSFLVLLLAWLALSATKPNEIHGIDLFLRIVVTIAVTVLILLVANLALKGYYGEPAPRLAFWVSFLCVAICMVRVWRNADVKPISPLRAIALALVSALAAMAVGYLVLVPLGLWWADGDAGKIIGITMFWWLLPQWRESR